MAYVTEDDILDAEQLVEATLSRDINSAFDECRRCITVTNWRLKMIGNEDGHRSLLHLVFCIGLSRNLMMVALV